MRTPNLKVGYRYTPHGLTETERRAKLLSLLQQCQREGMLTDREAATLNDAGIRLMRESWEE